MKFSDIISWTEGKIPIFSTSTVRKKVKGKINIFIFLHVCKCTHSHTHNPPPPTHVHTHNTERRMVLETFDYWKETGNSTTYFTLNINVTDYNPNATLV